MANVAARPTLGHQILHPLLVTAATPKTPTTAVVQATPTTAQASVGENPNYNAREIRLYNGRLLLQILPYAQTVPTLIQQWMSAYGGYVLCGT